MTERVGADQGTGFLLSPVVRALRFAGEEVQFGLVLATICQDRAVGTAFSDAVIARSRYGNAAARRRARREHGEVHCLGEQQLQARVTRRLTRARSKDVGRVDLRFTASNEWTLAVELKLNSDFGPKQLARYSDSGPVAAIVRDASTLEPLRDHPNWVGVASWAWLLDDLRLLPVDARWASEWLELLDVMESDGDFDLGIPSSREVLAQADLCEAIAKPLVQLLATELQRVYRADADVAVSGLVPSRVGQFSAWAGVGIEAQDGRWLWIAIRNLWSAAPRLSIDYDTFPDWRARRRLEKAHARIEARLAFRRRRPDSFRFEEAMPSLAQASAETALTVIGGILTELVDSRVFDVEIERLNREYG